MLKKTDIINTGEIRYAALNGSVALQGGKRPVLVVQNQTGCIYSPRIWVIPLSAKINKARHLPMHIYIPKTETNGLRENSIAQFCGRAAKLLNRQ